MSVADSRSPLSFNVVGCWLSCVAYRIGYGLLSVSVVNENFNNGPSPRKCVLECLAKYQTNSQILSPAVGIKLTHWVVELAHQPI